MEQIAYKPTAVAKMLGMEIKVVRASIADGKIPSIEVGTRRLVPRYWIEAQRSGPNTSRAS